MLACISGVTKTVLDSKRLEECETTVASCMAGVITLRKTDSQPVVKVAGLHHLTEQFVTRVKLASSSTSTRTCVKPELKSVVNNY